MENPYAYEGDPYEADPYELVRECLCYLNS